MTRAKGRSFVRQLLVLGGQYAFLAALVATPHAHADGLPDICTAPGQPCGEDASCTCRAEKCARQVPCSSCGTTVQCGNGGFGGNTADEDGGQQPPGNPWCTVYYACNRCHYPNGSSCLTGSGKSGRGGTGGRGGMGGRGGTGGSGGRGGDGDGGIGPSTDAGVAGSGGNPTSGEDCGCSSSGAAAGGGLFYGISAVIWALRKRKRAKRA